MSGEKNRSLKKMSKNSKNVVKTNKQTKNVVIHILSPLSKTLTLINSKLKLPSHKIYVTKHHDIFFPLGFFHACKHMKGFEP